MRRPVAVRLHYQRTGEVHCPGIQPAGGGGGRADLNPGIIGPDGKPDPAAPDAIAKIDAFLAANDKDPTLTATLRLNQTLLYLNEGAYSLADAAKGKITEKGSLQSPRDVVIYNIYPVLRWWHEQANAGGATFSSLEREHAVGHMDTLLKQVDDKTLPDLRDYLLEMRAWIGLKLGLATISVPDSVRIFEGAIDPWADKFSPSEISTLTDPNFKLLKPFDPSTRRILRARILLQTLAGMTSSQQNAELKFNNPKLTDYYQALPKAH